MSSSMGASGGNYSAPSTSTSKVTPLLLLALAVAVGVAILHGIDDTPTATEASLQATQAAQESAAAPVTVAAPTTLPVRSPNEVKVLIANGTNISGVAAKLNAKLQPIGYQLGTPGNTTTPNTSTTVQYASGYQTEAQAVATSLGIDTSLVQPLATPTPMADIQGANVVVVMGTELAQQTQQAPAASTNAATATGTNSGSASATTTTVARSAGANGPLATYGNTATTTVSR